MNLSKLQLFEIIDIVNEWSTKEWCDKELEGKIICMEFIEPFIELERFIESKENYKDIIGYMLSTYEGYILRNIKRTYEETKRFVGFNSLEVNFLLDDLMDELNIKESFEDLKNGELKGYAIHGKSWGSTN